MHRSATPHRKRSSLRAGTHADAPERHKSDTTQTQQRAEVRHNPCAAAAARVHRASVLPCYVTSGRSASNPSNTNSGSAFGMIPSTVARYRSAPHRPSSG